MSLTKFKRPKLLQKHEAPAEQVKVEKKKKLSAKKKK